VEVRPPEGLPPLPPLLSLVWLVPSAYLLKWGFGAACAFGLLAGVAFAVGAETFFFLGAGGFLLVIRDLAWNCGVGVSASPSCEEAEGSISASFFEAVEIILKQDIDPEDQAQSIVLRVGIVRDLMACRITEERHDPQGQLHRSTLFWFVSA